MLHVHPSAQSSPADLGPACHVQPQPSMGGGVKKKKIKDIAFPKSLMKNGAMKR